MNPTGLDYLQVPSSSVIILPDGTATAGFSVSISPTSVTCFPQAKICWENSWRGGGGGGGGSPGSLQRMTNSLAFNVLASPASIRLKVHSDRPKATWCPHPVCNRIMCTPVPAWGQPSAQIVCLTTPSPEPTMCVPGLPPSLARSRPLRGMS